MYTTDGLKMSQNDGSAVIVMKHPQNAHLPKPESLTKARAFNIMSPSDGLGSPRTASIAGKLKGTKFDSSTKLLQRMPQPC